MKQGTYQEPSGVASMTNTPARGKGFADVGKKYQWRPHQLPGVASMTNTPARGKGFADVGKKYQQPLLPGPADPSGHADHIIHTSEQETGQKGFESLRLAGINQKFIASR